MDPKKNAGRMQAKANERKRTHPERRAHCTKMATAVRDYLDGHFNSGGTLEELKNLGDPARNPDTPGQHGSVSIVRLPLPATQDGLFVIKDLGSPLKTPYRSISKDADGNDTYILEAKDLWAEASAMKFLGTHTDIPVPWVYTSCAADEKGPERSFLAMEYVEGTVFRTGMTLTEFQKNSIIKQMAAIRIRMIEITSELIGGVDWPILPDGTPSTIKLKDKHSAGVMSGPRVWGDGRVRYSYYPSLNLSLSKSTSRLTRLHVFIASSPEFNNTKPGSLYLCSRFRQCVLSKRSHLSFHESEGHNSPGG